MAYILVHGLQVVHNLNYMSDSLTGQTRENERVLDEKRELSFAYDFMKYWETLGCSNVP